ncbi:MAG: IMP cyclohydrolase [Faecalibacterium sp.]|nr:IMP cyclohydrolase [Faecalibacterium sp.]
MDIYKINTPEELIQGNSYVGRGIVIGKTPDASKAVIAYFIMGRSENSRNRVFDPVPERGGICTIAADPAKLEDPSLIIYNPVLTLGKTHIVTNGDQTDTIYDLMSQGKSFADALRTRTFEPDGPNYTPRISAVVYADGSYQMSILKSADGNGDSVQRYFFDYPQPVAGEGHFISTYKHNGNPIPSFEGEPLRFACPRTIGDFAHDLWSSLNLDNKVSLFARVIDLETGESGDMIFNKYDPVCSDLDDPEEPELLPEELELLKKLDAEEE